MTTPLQRWIWPRSESQVLRSDHRLARGGASSPPPPRQSQSTQLPQSSSITILRRRCRWLRTGVTTEWGRSDHKACHLLPPSHQIRSHQHRGHLSNLPPTQGPPKPKPPHHHIKAHQKCPAETLVNLVQCECSRDLTWAVRMCLKGRVRGYVSS